MREFLKKIFGFWPKGLAGKIITFAVTFTIFIGFVFFILSVGQVHILQNIVGNESEETTALVEKESTESMEALTRDSLKEISFCAADLTDDELWVNSYEMKILAAQVADVISHPENYGRKPVYPPDKSNAGELSLQLLSPNGYENVPPETMDMMERLANLEPIMGTYIGEYTIDCYISLPDGTTLAMDKLSDQKFDEDGNVKNYDATTRPWYKGAIEEEDLYFGPAVKSYFYGINVVIYSYPVYVDGELVAALEGTLKMDGLEDKVNHTLLGETGFNVLITKDGQLVSTPKTEGELSMREDLSEDIRTTVNESLAEVIDKGLAGENDTDIVELDGEKYYVGYAPLVTVGWTQLSFVSVDEIQKPSNALVGELRSTHDTMIKKLKTGFQRNIWIMLATLLLFVTGINLFVSRFSKKMVKPIERMTENARAFVGNEMNFEMEDTFRTGDEIQVLAESFEEMSVKMKAYVNEIVYISAEKERIETEMDMATQIQESMLPKIEPEFSGKSQYDLYARTVPAISVGGDFYDFFYVDEDHLGIVMADVSGKGITAALFMALSKQMIQSEMHIHKGEVAEALSDANRRLLDESVPDMFVTVWLGLLTLSTGKLVFVDAGHEYPAIKQGSNGFVIEKDIHSMAVAALKRTKFKVNEMELQPGDTIYLYTDGVTEAHNSEGEMFGRDRLTEALNEVSDKSPQEIDDHVRKKVAEFAGEAEQYDDITSFCLKYLG